jgi:hypothetical protein
MAIVGMFKPSFFQSDFEDYRDAKQRLHDMMYIGVSITQPFSLDDIAQAMKRSGARWGLYGDTAAEHLFVIGAAMDDIQKKRATKIT